MFVMSWYDAWYLLKEGVLRDVKIIEGGKFQRKSRKTQMWYRNGIMV